MRRSSAFATLLLAVLLATTLSYAENIPQDYYNDIEGKSDSVLKSTLSLICRSGERYEYGTTQYHSTNNPPEWVKGDLKAYGTWQALPLTDRREDGSVWDMYSNSVRYFPNKQGESGCSLNIEHCFPKSWWGGTVNDAYKDLYHLNPSDAQANSNKSNYPPGHVRKGDKFDNGSFRMDSKSKSAYGYICFEPAPEYRGDFARAYFYIATAYEYLTWAADYSAYVSNARYTVFSDSIQKVLLDWHRSDPVSDKEVCRADRISSIQHNRNPFIDYPELVEYIWGDRKGQTVSLSALTCATGSTTCTEYMPPADTEHLYDTLINLPALTKALVNAVPGGFASEKIGATGAGSAAVTMGASTTDGWLSFSGLNLQDSAVLVFRASVYNTAASMQLDIYADTTLLRSVYDTARLNTRNEVRYRIAIPAGTDSITIMSVGGATTKRACMQELYLLKRRHDTPSSVSNNRTETEENREAEKFIEKGRLYIRRGGRIYNDTGQLLH